MAKLTNAATLEPVSISYTIGLESSKIGDAKIGKVKTTLSTTEQGYAIETVTRFQGMAAIISGSNRQQACEFEVVDGKAVTTSYSGGRLKKVDYQVGFDWDKRKIDFGNDQILDMPEGYIVNNCVMSFAVALLKDQGLGDVAMYSIDGIDNRIRGYKQRSREFETIETRLGEKKVMKLVLERELRPDRTFTFWLSPDDQYLPLKIRQSRKSRTITFEVETLELSGS